MAFSSFLGDGNRCPDTVSDHSCGGTRFENIDRIAASTFSFRLASVAWAETCFCDMIITGKNDNMLNKLENNP